MLVRLLPWVWVGERSLALATPQLLTLAKGALATPQVLTLAKGALDSPKKEGQGLLRVHYLDPPMYLY